MSSPTESMSIRAQQMGESHGPPIFNSAALRSWFAGAAAIFILAACVGRNPVTVPAKNERVEIEIPSERDAIQLVDADYVNGDLASLIPDGVWWVRTGEFTAILKMENCRGSVHVLTPRGVTVGTVRLWIPAFERLAEVDLTSEAPTDADSEDDELCLHYSLLLDAGATVWIGDIPGSDEPTPIEDLGTSRERIDTVVIHRIRGNLGEGAAPLQLLHSRYHNPVAGLSQEEASKIRALIRAVASDD